MTLIKKIFTGVWAAISMLWGGHASDESLIIGLITMVVAVGLFFALFAILNKFTKWSMDRCSFTAIGTVVAVIFVFCTICIIIDH